MIEQLIVENGLKNSTSENLLSNMDSNIGKFEKNLNANEILSIKDNDGNKTEIIPLNYTEQSYSNLLSSGRFNDADNKIFVVNKEFYNQPMDVINKIESNAKVIGYDFKNPPVDFVSTRNQSLNNSTHPETGVLFETKEIIVNGEKKEGVFAQFDSIYDAKISDGNLQVSDKEQFKEANKSLKENILAGKADETLAGLSNDLYHSNKEEKALCDDELDNRLVDIVEEKTPDGFTWHHSEEPGKLDLVSTEEHKKTGHTGGKNTWGGGSNAR